MVANRSAHDGIADCPQLTGAVRRAVASELAAGHGGVVHRRELAEHGIGRFAVRDEIAAGRWFRGAGIPRVRVEPATIHAAQWAVSDRQAALLICLPIQQRLTSPVRLQLAWRGVRRSARRPFLNAIITDVTDGAHSLGELDFTRMARQAGLPAPSHQSVRSGPGGRVYLDISWDEVGLVVEIDGGHHALALNPVDDALRQNDRVVAGERVLRIPVVGFRIAADRFMLQVRHTYDALCRS